MNTAKTRLVAALLFLGTAARGNEPSAIRLPDVIEEE